jgi:DNA-binding transcriptional ArsR family regulator
MAALGSFGPSVMSRPPFADRGVDRAGSRQLKFNFVVERSGTVALDRTYAALAHPIRRSMLELLRHGDLRVTEVARPFDISLAAASKHVRVLETAGLVSRRIAGRDHILSFEPRPLAAAGDWIEEARSFWEARLDVLGSDLRLRPS